MTAREVARQQTTDPVLTAMFLDGKTLEEIAVVLGCSSRSVKRRAMKLKLRRTKEYVSKAHTWSDTQKQAQSQVRKGKPKSDETRARMSAAQKKRWATGTHNE